MAKTTVALVVAAGRGSRLAQTKNAMPKQYRLLSGRPVLAHTLEKLGSHSAIFTVITVIHPDDRDLYEKTISYLPDEVVKKLTPPVLGAETRQQSVFNGLKSLERNASPFVLVHDAARPFVTHDTVSRLISSLSEGASGALAAVKVTDTLKRKRSGAGKLETVDRTDLWSAQTPQGFPLEALLSAHESAALGGRTDFTDDTSLVEWHGSEVTICESDSNNFKITTLADLERAELLARYQNMTKQIKQPPYSTLNDIRNGTGYDVHAFEDGDHVVLGGVSIPHTHKLKGHSDADVVLHAITDATLGAIGDGDIGSHFPPSDPQWKGASSDRFQMDAVRRVAELGGRISHIDVTIVCEAPKIGPHRDEIRSAIAAICSLALERVSVKATTSEQLGFTGRREGIAALAAVTVRLPLNENE